MSTTAAVSSRHGKSFAGAVVVRPSVGPRFRSGDNASSVVRGSAQPGAAVAGCWLRCGALVRAGCPRTSTPTIADLGCGEAVPKAGRMPVSLWRKGERSAIRLSLRALKRFRGCRAESAKNPKSSVRRTSVSFLLRNPTLLPTARLGPKKPDRKREPVCLFASNGPAPRGAVVAERSGAENGSNSGTVLFLSQVYSAPTPTVSQSPTHPIHW